MNGRRHTNSTLHLQMGQEVMYLLLVTSLLANFILAALALRHAKKEEEISPPIPLPPIVAPQPPAQAPPAPKPLPNPPATSPQPPPLAPEATLPPQPPIIPLREEKGFRFDPGSSEVKFIEKLRLETVPDIIRLSQQYGAQIVEVIGHTDGTSIRDSSRLKANLDDALGPFTLGTSAILPLPYDNAGLGIARAASVAKALRQAGLPTTLDIHPLSASYLLAPNDRFDPAILKKDDTSRRRIDIRIRRINSN